MIGVIILNYKTFPDTIRLVRELQQQTISPRLHIVVVDNASPNNSYDELKPLEGEFANVVVLQTGENLGYAKGNNFGLKYLEDNVNPEYVAILNNDVVLPNDCFECLCERYTELDKPGFIAPAMLNPDGRRVISPYKLNTFTVDCLSLFVIFRRLYKKRRTKFVKNSDARDMAVDTIPGSFLFSSFEVFRKIGYFYPNTFLYAEERFIAFNIKEIGLQSYILQDQTYIHAHNSPTISSVYDNVSKHRLLYAGWKEFTRVFRRHGKLKSLIFTLLSKYSLCEIWFIDRLKSLKKR